MAAWCRLSVIIILLLTLLVVTLLDIAYPYIFLEVPNTPSVKATKHEQRLPLSRTAFVVSLCHVRGFESYPTDALVLIHSLKTYASSGRDIVVVMSRPRLSITFSERGENGAMQTVKIDDESTASNLYRRWHGLRQTLTEMNVTVVTVDESDIMETERLYEDEDFNIRYCQLLPWKLTKYERIINLESHLLVLSDLEDLFDYGLGDFAAARHSHLPSIFDESVIALKPNISLFRLMVKKLAEIDLTKMSHSDYLMSQFLDLWRSDRQGAVLSFEYNADVTLSLTPMWKAFGEGRVKILNFPKSLLPWIDVPDTRDNKVALRYYDLWRMAYNDYIRRQRARSKAVREGLISSNKSSSPNFSKHCEKKLFSKSPPTVVDRFSVIINTFDRFSMLKYLVSYYSKMSIVHKIYVVWGDPHTSPLPLSYFNASNVEMLNYGSDNLNDRFRPVRSLATDAVLICDDDVFVDKKALEFAFGEWKKRRHTLVGFSGRRHKFNFTAKKFIYARGRTQYSLVLTKILMMHSEYLHTYWCSLNEKVRSFIEIHKNCEDIAINFLAATASETPTIVVNDFNKIDFGTTSGLSVRTTHLITRSKCINDITSLVGNFPLKVANTSMSLFSHDPTTEHLHRSIISQEAESGRHLFTLLNFTEAEDDATHNATHNMFNEIKPHRIPENIFSDDVLCLSDDNSKGVKVMITKRLNVSLLEMRKFETAMIIFLERESLDSLASLSWAVHLLANNLMNYGVLKVHKVFFIKDGVRILALERWADFILEGYFRKKPAFTLGSGLKSFTLNNQQICFDESFLVSEKMLSGSLKSDGGCGAWTGIHQWLAQMTSRSGKRENSSIEIHFWGTHFPQFEVLLNSSIRECSFGGLKCEMVKLNASSSVPHQASVVRRADISIVNWNDPLFENVIFMPRDSTVVIVPPVGSPQVSKYEINAKNMRHITECLGINLVEVSNSSEIAIITSVRDALKRIKLRTKVSF